jgi:hypothetical protein
MYTTITWFRIDFSWALVSTVLNINLYKTENFFIQLSDYQHLQACSKGSVK